MGSFGELTAQGHASVDEGPGSGRLALVLRVPLRGCFAVEERSLQLRDSEHPGDGSDLEETRDWGWKPGVCPHTGVSLPWVWRWVGCTEAHALVFTPPWRTATVPRPRGWLWRVLLRLEEERCHWVSPQRSCGQRCHELLPPTCPFLSSLGGCQRHLCGNPEGSSSGCPGKERHPPMHLQHFFPEPRRIHRVGQAPVKSHGKEP